LRRYTVARRFLVCRGALGVCVGELTHEAGAYTRPPLSST
jgi:hypothetical protein